MGKTATKSQLMLAQVALVLVMGFALAGLIWHGFSAEVRTRVVQGIIERPGGPMTFRFLLQPTMAAIAAAIDGMKDARTGSSPYFWSLLTDPATRGERLNEGVISTARIILLGLGMDVIYQFIAFGTFFPGEAAIIAVLLAFVPYVLLRGPFSRIARHWLGRQKSGA